MIASPNPGKLTGLWLGACAGLVLLANVERASAQVVNVPIPPVPIFPVTSQLELGPVLDVVPYVLADGFTIQLTLVPSVREFVGYDNPPNIAIPTQPNTVIVPSVLPRFRIRQVITSVDVWDGQTVVMGGMLSENSTVQKDSVPVLGDMPLIGRLFRSESSISTKRNLLIFVSPTLIDPAGNRLHTDEEMPFAQTAVPPQVKPQASATGSPAAAMPAAPPAGTAMNMGGMNMPAPPAGAKP